MHWVWGNSCLLLRISFWILPLESKGTFSRHEKGHKISLSSFDVHVKCECIGSFGLGNRNKAPNDWSDIIRSSKKGRGGSEKSPSSWYWTPAHNKAAVGRMPFSATVLLRRAARYAITTTATESRGTVTYVWFPVGQQRDVLQTQPPEEIWRQHHVHQLHPQTGRTLLDSIEIFAWSTRNKDAGCPRCYHTDQLSTVGYKAT